MNRRSFIAGLAALLPTSALASGIQIPAAIPTSAPNMAYALNNYPTMLRVVQSFPKTPVTDFSMPNRTHFVTMQTAETSNEMMLTVKADICDPSENFMLDKIFLEDDIEVLDLRERDHTVSAIVSGANRIARKTRRGKGNHYAIFEDHVLVWYQNSNSIFGPTYDAPAQMLGNNLAYHSNYKDYFVRVKCKELTDEDHANLKKLGYTKV